MNKKCIENNSKVRLDMEFLFQCSSPFLTGERKIEISN